MARKFFIDKETLNHLYITEDKSSIQIAEELKVCVATICNALRKHKIPKKPAKRYLQAGQKFGKLTLVKPIAVQNSRVSHWLCLCECGNERPWTHNAIWYASKKCRCEEVKSYREISGSFFSSMRFGAKKRNLNFDVTVEEIYELFEKQQGKCALSGVDIVLSLNYKFKTASLDRIDSSKGYTLSNIQWIHKNLNEMKSDYSQEEFIDWARKIAAYRAL